MIQQQEIILPHYPKGIHLVTRDILKNINHLPKTGIMNIFIQHTSAGICINENADPSVRVDMDTFLRRLIPENSDYLTHTMEGPDDMPAHIKSTFFGSDLNIPIIESQLGLGMWQGIYLGEFRNNGGRRKLIISIYS